LRILHVAYIYPPTPNVADGITNVVYNVTQELAKRGHEVAVYTSDMLDLHGNASIKTKKEVINDVTVYYLQSLWRYKTFIVTPSILALLSKKLNTFNIIHIHDCRSFQGIFAYLFAKMKNVPYVFQPHGSYLFSLSDSLSKTVAKIALDKLVSGKIIQNASKVIALSKVEAEAYKCAGVPAETIAIIPNGIDLTEYSVLPSSGSFKKKFGLNKYSKIVLYLGRIHEIKGIDILVKAFAKILHQLDNVRLVIVGPNDGYLDVIEALTKTLQIEDKVLVLGPLYGEAKLEAYVDADIFVLPSRYDTFPMTVLEAYACGKPVIASKVGGLKDLVVNGETGLLFDFGNVVQLATHILYLLDYPGRAEEMGFKGKQFVTENFNIDKVADKLQNLYAAAAKY
jgi:glycosyltransferase involved in cell wall biosynthesis